MGLIFSASCWCFYGALLFLFIQQYHISTFAGAGRDLIVIEQAIFTAGGIAVLVYLIYCGITAKWWLPFIALGAGSIGVSIVRAILNLIIPEWITSIVGWIAVPVLCFLMFYLL